MDDQEYDPHALIAACREGELYGYVANHYDEMTKEELKDVVLETLWHAFDEGEGDPEVMGAIAKGLEAVWGLEEPVSN